MKYKALNIAISLFREWNEHKVRYCHWKSNEHLHEGLSGKTDLDVLVDIKQKDQAKKYLTLLDYIEIVPQFGSRYPLVEDWIGFDKEQGKFIHIHLHYQILTGHMGLKEYVLPMSEDILISRILDDDYPVYIVDPNLELVLLYIRVGIKADFNDLLYAKLGKFCLATDSLREILYLKQRIEWERVKIILDKYFTSRSDVTFQIMKEENYDSRWMARLNKEVIKNFDENNCVGKGALILRIVYKIAIYGRFGLRKYLFHNLVVRKTFGEKRGLSIAIVGQDGAGKSTVSDEIKLWLSWKIDVKKYYLGSGDHYFSWQKKVVEMLEKSENRLLKIIRVCAALSNLIHLAKRNYKMINKAKKFVDKGGVVVFDRFPQIQFIGINDGPKIRPMVDKANNVIITKFISYYARREEAYLKRASDIAPDLVIKLILPVEVSLTRKPEEEKTVVRNKHNVVQKLYFKDSECILIDATLPYEEEILKLHNSIWNMLLRKNKTLDEVMNNDTL